MSLSESFGPPALLAAAVLCASACRTREPYLGDHGDAAALDAGTDTSLDGNDERAAAVGSGPPCRVGGTSADLPTTLGCAQAQPGRLVIAGDHIYWTVLGPGGIVWRAPLVGGGAEALVYDTAGAFGLVVDADFAYYTQASVGRVMRLPLAGGAPLAIATRANEPLDLVSDGASLFWTDGEVDGKIVKLDLAAGAKPITLIDGQSRPRAIAVRDGFVYWTDVTDGTVLRTLDHLTGPPDAGVRTASRLASGLKSPTDLVLLGAYAYVPDEVGQIRRVPLEGGDLETVAHVDGVPYGIATDGTSIYWSTAATVGGIFATPPDSGGAGPITLIVGKQADPRFLAVTSDNVYWGTWGGHPAVHRLAK